MSVVPHGGLFRMVWGGHCSQATSLVPRRSSKCPYLRRSESVQFESLLKCEHCPLLCCHPNLFLTHGELILTWAFLPSLTHLRIAQTPGSGLKWHYFWLLMTSPKPAMQFKYPLECPGSISTRWDLVMGPGGGGCWAGHPCPGSSAVELQHDVGPQVSRFSALS